MYISTIDIMLWVHCLVFLLVFALIQYLISKINKINDTFGIGLELKCINLCFAGFTLLGYIARAVLAHLDLQQWQALTATLCSLLSITCSLYIGSFFVLRQLFRDHADTQTLKHLAKNVTLQRIMTSPSSRSAKESEMKKELKMNPLQPNPLQLNQVLSTQKGFEYALPAILRKLSATSRKDVCV